MKNKTVEVSYENSKAIKFSEIPAVIHVDKIRILVSSSISYKFISASKTESGILVKYKLFINNETSKVFEKVINKDQFKTEDVILQPKNIDKNTDSTQPKLNEGITKQQENNSKSQGDNSTPNNTNPKTNQNKSIYKEFTDNLEHEIQQSNNFTNEDKKQLNVFINEFKQNEDLTTKQILEEKIVNFILQKFNETRQMFLLTRIAVNFVKITNDPEFTKQLKQVTKSLNSIQDIISIVKNPRITIDQENIKILNGLYKTILDKIKLNKYTFDQIKINQLVFKNDSVFPLFTLTDQEIKDMQDSLVFKLVGNELELETHNISTQNDNTAKNKVALSINLIEDLKASQTIENISLYSKFEKVSENSGTEKDQKWLSNVYNEEFFKIKKLIYLNIDPNILILDGELVAIYQIPFSIKDNKVVKENRYIFKKNTKTELDAVEFPQLLRLLKGIYIEISKEIDTSSIIQENTN
ncbi:hypothetical protein [Mycoplasma zalophi]|uniref:hypothetical protein n=1 Tax=Mycoplasma zalophi TaxID=191287 RepID=UPI001C1287DB|nr:hypothetical protein [Mycoplasma zalophi]MBU4690955.1 hypothetical protein [Mycoplasma zalophi]